MYKSKLQEICQKRAWDLPEYSTSRDGPDHNPRFQATVTVRGFSFQSEIIGRSSKEAQNDAARVAFLYFTSSGDSSSNVIKEESSNISAEQGNASAETPPSVRNETSNAPAPTADPREVGTKKDVQHLCKAQLQYYAQKRKLALPIYYCENMGSPHVSRFRCKVTFGEQTFEGPEFCPTLKEAENAAASVALKSLSLDSAQEASFQFFPTRLWDDSSVYKNLLQELAQKEGCDLPIYSTLTSGEAHRPVFISSVQIKDRVFQGECAKTKKMAEMMAAKVAYTTLKGVNGGEGPRGDDVGYHQLPEQRVEITSPSLQLNYSNNQVTNPVPLNLASPRPLVTDPVPQPVIHPKPLVSEPVPQPVIRPNPQFTDPVPQRAIHPKPRVTDPVPQAAICPKPQVSDLVPQAAICPKREPVFEAFPEPMVQTSSRPDNQSAHKQIGTSSRQRVVVRPRSSANKLPPDSHVLVSDEKWIAVRVGSLQNHSYS